MKLSVLLFISLIYSSSLEAWPPEGEGDDLSDDEHLQYYDHYYSSHLQNLLEINAISNDAPSNSTLLLRAVQKASKKSSAYLPVIENLLELHADPNIANHEGITPLMVAAGSTRTKSEVIVAQLLFRNARVNVSANDGSSALSRAHTALQNAQSETHKARAQHIVNMLRIKSALEMLTSLPNYAS